MAPVVTVAGMDRPDAATWWRSRLRASLLAAQKARDTVRIQALRSALSAIDNAETPSETHIEIRNAGEIANSVAGLGAAEVQRRELRGDEILDLLRAEVAERLDAGTQYERAGQTGRAEVTRAEAAVLGEFL
jgi:uncharacterized protein